MRYAILPSVGLNTVAPTVYVLAENAESAVEAAKFVTSEKSSEGFKITGWPAACLTHFPSYANVVNAIS